MEKVKVEKKALLDAVRKNRESHRGLFLKACDGYRAECIKRLDEALNDAKANKRIVMAFGLAEPVDMTKEYDRIIRMLEMSVDDTVELTTEEFAQYVMDDWRWAAHARATNSTYLR